MQEDEHKDVPDLPEKVPKEAEGEAAAGSLKAGGWLKGEPCEVLTLPSAL